MNKFFLTSSLLITLFMQSPPSIAAEIAMPALAGSQQACKESVQPILNAIKAAVERADAATAGDLARLAIRTTAICATKP